MVPRLQVVDSNMYMASLEGRKGSADLDRLIHEFRGLRVMLDSDLARIYGVSTKHLKQAVRRNAYRFPTDFAFELDVQEFAALRSQFVTSKGRGGSRYRPIVFTEHGAIMLASVLNSPLAVQASVQVVRAFVRMRDYLSTHRQLAAKLADLEERVAGHDQSLAEVFETIRRLMGTGEASRREIGFHVRETAPRYRVAGRART